VELRGVGRDAEAHRDGLVAEPLGQHAQHLDLARGERLGRIGGAPRGPRLAPRPTRGRQRIGQRIWVKDHEACDHRVDRGQDLARGGVTRQHRADLAALHREVGARAPRRVRQHDERGRHRVR
jgi:hypothetical protein